MSGLSKCSFNSAISSQNSDSAIKNCLGRVHETEIFALCASRLAGYKCPAELHVVGQLPMTAAHKLDRIALRRAVTAEEQSSIGTR